MAKHTTVNGRAISEDILKSVKKLMKGKDSLIMRAIVVAPTTATASYLRAKARAAETAGLQFESVELPADATTEDIIDAVHVSNADAIIVQLPLPDHIDTELVLSAIPSEKDADALSPAARHTGIPVPPVAAAVEEILMRSGVEIKGKRTVMIGKGRLVGAPVALRLAALGAHVSAYDIHDFDPVQLAEADIIVSGAGVHHLVKPEMVSEGVVLIDAGTSEAPEGEGGVVGDIDPEAAEKASVYTPVPGGVGPVTVACLMRNAVQLRGGHNPVL